MNASIILPVYNEAESVREGIERLAALGLDAEIIVVDDGSTDGTAEILGSLGGIKVVRNEENTGYGAAIKRGLEEASCDRILIIDADGSYPYERVPELLAGLDRYDMVIGARPSSSFSPVRRLPKAFLRALASFLCNRQIPDLNSGFRAFRKELAQRFLTILPSGFSLTATLTIASLASGLKVGFVPIEYFKRAGKSKIHPLRDTANFFFIVLRTVMYLNPLKVFLPISLLLMSGGGGLALYQALFRQNVTDVAVMTTLVGVQVGVLGLLADLIVKRTRL